VVGSVAGQLPVALGGIVAVGLVAWSFQDRNNEPNRHDPAVTCTASRTTKKRTAVSAVYGMRLPESVSPAIVTSELAVIAGVQAVDVGRARTPS
jgi:hypothetical protein